MLRRHQHAPVHGGRCVQAGRRVNTFVDDLGGHTAPASRTAPPCLNVTHGDPSGTDTRRDHQYLPPYSAFCGPRSDGTSRRC